MHLGPGAASADDPDVPLMYDIDERGELPEDAMRARYGAPETNRELDVAVGELLDEMRIEVLNVVDDRLDAGETVRVRELEWALPNAWRRVVWLSEEPGGWAVADGLEWAADRVEF